MKNLFLTILVSVGYLAGCTANVVPEQVESAEEALTTCKTASWANRVPYLGQDSKDTVLILKLTDVSRPFRYQGNISGCANYQNDLGTTQYQSCDVWHHSSSQWEWEIDARFRRDTSSEWGPWTPVVNAMGSPFATLSGLAPTYVYRLPSQSSWAYGAGRLDRQSNGELRWSYCYGN